MLFCRVGKKVQPLSLPLYQYLINLSVTVSETSTYLSGFVGSNSIRIAVGFGVFFWFSFPFLARCVEVLSESISAANSSVPRVGCSPRPFFFMWWLLLLFSKCKSQTCSKLVSSHEADDLH